MAEFIKLDFEDESDILARMSANEETARLTVKRILDDLADFGYHVLQSHVPVHSSYLLRHVDKKHSRWRPGGAGGGGEYEAVVGIKRGTSKHPYYVEFGTGLYGVVGWYIVPVRMPYMYFYSTKYHMDMRLTHTRGQRPQRYMYITWRELLIYAKGRMAVAGILR